MRQGLRTVLLTAFLAACGGSPAREAARRYPLVPVPLALAPAAGELRLGAGTVVVLAGAADAELQRLAEGWAAPLREASGFPLPVEVRAAPGPRRDAVVVVLDPTLGEDLVPAPTHPAARGSAGAPPGPGGDEGYALSVSPERALLSARTHAGIFRGLQTLRELVPPEMEVAFRRLSPWDALAWPSGAEGPVPSPRDGWRVPAVEIRDAPRFPWRGMHLDVGRHFFSVEFVKKYIDLLALHRMNVFHWHLTEDQGWRIEIRKYPRLTGVGGCRAETQLARNNDPFVGDGVRYCGHYTQEEVRDVVAYAAERYVTVVPEIEMPGHSRAALAAHPELACTDGPFEVATRWGVFEEVYCPKEETFAFLEDVLSEVIELFPSGYVHVGGDEAPRKAWEESPVAQEVIRREGLADEAELQGWFIRRVERFLRSRGRRLVGWDEILEGGLAPDATVMSWRGNEGGIEAARHGHDVVMSPTSHAYFDYYQGPRETEPLAIGGDLRLETVYGFEPVPEELTADEARHVLGVQGNVWTEYMKTPDHVEYMALPRMAAMAEVAWSPAGRRDWESFRWRLEEHLRRLDGLGTRYRTPDWLR